MTGQTLAGVMGIQDVDDVTLIRHAYVRPDRQCVGVGGRLLRRYWRIPERQVETSVVLRFAPPGG